ncbi:hypothetical protein AUJ14_01430 [Candidatus Micrarchaeota archaeon CG1_02_55_22]|nr:MAG: hypothetical protein AUJ14_01430 [Candidatus Micrarchaeota archaeon CG1_02_55_22]
MILSLDAAIAATILVAAVLLSVQFFSTHGAALLEDEALFAQRLSLDARSSIALYRKGNATLTGLGKEPPKGECVRRLKYDGEIMLVSVCAKDSH